MAKKISVQDPEFARRVIQKELDFHGASFDDVKALTDGKLPNGTPWYQHYTFDTPEQYQEWKDFCIAEYRNTKEKYTVTMAEQAFMWLDLTYGLKQTYITHE